MHEEQEKPEVSTKAELAKQTLRRQFDLKYCDFKSNTDINRAWLITVHFDHEKTDPIVTFYNQQELITFPYGNLPELFRKSFSGDIDNSIPQIKYGQSIYIRDEDGMPSGLKSMVGTKIWEETRVNKLTLENGRPGSIFQTRYYPLLEKSKGIPLIEFWLAERPDIPKRLQSSTRTNGATIIIPPIATVRKVS